MADLFAEVLTVVHHDDSRTVYERVSYCPWPDGVTVYRDDEEIQHDDVLTLWTETLAAT